MLKATSCFLLLNYQFVDSKQNAQIVFMEIFLLKNFLSSDCWSPDWNTISICEGKKCSALYVEKSKKMHLQNHIFLLIATVVSCNLMENKCNGYQNLLVTFRVYSPEHSSVSLTFLKIRITWSVGSTDTSHTVFLEILP